MKLYTAELVLTQNDAQAYRPGAVLVDQDTIAWVGGLADFPASAYPDNLHVQDLGDVTIMPGLIDAHVHLGFDGGPTPAARMMALPPLDPDSLPPLLQAALAGDPGITHRLTPGAEPIEAT